MTILYIAVEDLMILRMQDFDFCPNLIKFYSNFTQFTQTSQILPKLTQIYSNLLKFSKFYPNLTTQTD